jgi:hypothetical protein
VLTSHNPIAITAQRPAAPIGAHRGWAIGSSLKSATVRFSWSASDSDAGFGRRALQRDSSASGQAPIVWPGVIECIPSDCLLVQFQAHGTNSALSRSDTQRRSHRAFPGGRSSHVRSPSRPARTLTPLAKPKMNCVSIFSPTSSVRTPACNWARSPTTSSDTGQDFRAPNSFL